MTENTKAVDAVNSEDALFMEVNNETGERRKLKETVLYHKSVYVNGYGKDGYEVVVSVFRSSRWDVSLLDKSKLIIISSRFCCEGILDGIDPGKFMFSGRDAGAVLIPPISKRRDREDLLIVCNEPGDKEAAIRKAMGIVDHIDELFCLYAEAAKVHREKGVREPKESGDA